MTSGEARGCGDEPETAIMPRAPRFRIAAVAELHRQLRYVSREVRLRQMNAAEALLADIEPGRNYPEDFVIWRITGYRPESRSEPVMLVGEALVGDLASLVQRLSHGLGLGADHGGRSAVALDDVARELNVSAKTLQRYRRLGLVCHYVEDQAGGRPSLACFRDAIDAFVARHRGQVGRAAAFSRTTSDFHANIVAEARGLREAEGVSLNEAARRLARRHGRAHETIRNMLRRHDRACGDAPIFREHGPLTDRDIRVIHRAWRRNIPLATLSRRFGKSATTIRRAYHRHRGDRLRGIELAWVELPTFDLEDAEAIILSAPVLAGPLDAVLPADDALALIASARAAPPLAEADEHGLVAGYNALKRRAARGVAALGPWPRAARIDAIERDLAWAFRVKRKLISLGLAAAVVRIEQNIHRPLGDEPAGRIVAMLRLGRDVVSRTVETIDPGRGQHFERMLRYAMDRALARFESQITRTDAPPRAAARHAPGSVAVADLYDDLVPWQTLVDTTVG